jgi:hypothetical protein
MNARYRRALGQTAMLVTPSAIACDRPSKTCQVFFDVRAEFFLERGARVTSHFAVDRYLHAE